jgi:hypothetical protein
MKTLLKFLKYRVHFLLTIYIIWRLENKAVKKYVFLLM